MAKGKSGSGDGLAGWSGVGAPQEVPDVVVGRLPLYMRALNELLAEGIREVSSEYLGRRLPMTPAQIRKDLGCFGRFGKQGRGYNVPYLAGEVRRILALDREWRVALVWVGRLGGAILAYPGFAPEGFRIVGAFDCDPGVIGQRVGNITVQSSDELEGTLARHRVRIAIAAVPARRTQSLVDRLVAAGVRAILNYAPTSPRVPPGVKVRNIDPVLALQSMTYYLPSTAATPASPRPHRTGAGGAPP